MADIDNYKTLIDNLFAEVAKVVVGQDQVIRQIMVGLITDSNILLEGYPGLAKTLSVRTISQLLDLSFSRIQSTPDLMPSDILGTFVLEENKGKKEFKFKKGPIFANIVLVDEINRATPKTQSALLESMQEKQVTMGNETFQLDKPFFVLATQNPIEQSGTYQLPEAQSDRFLLKIKADYPNITEELEIVDRYAEVIKHHELKQILKKESLFHLQTLVRQMPIANDIKKYAVNIVASTRAKKDLIEYGASPRASIGLVLAAKANAFLEGRRYVSKEDINKMAYPILRHRIILNFEAERNNMKEDDVVRTLLK